MTPLSPFAGGIIKEKVHRTTCQLFSGGDMKKVVVIAGWIIACSVMVSAQKNPQILDVRDWRFNDGVQIASMHIESRVSGLIARLYLP